MEEEGMGKVENGLRWFLLAKRSGVCHTRLIKYVYVKDSILSIKEVMFMDKRISIDPKICHGQACIKGTRISVHQIIRMMAKDDTTEELLGEYPSISRNDILACLNYAASTAKKIDIGRKHC